MNKEITKISSMLNKEIWSISWVLYITNNFCRFSLSFCFWKCQYSWRKNPLSGVRSFIYPKYIYVTSILLVRHGFGINWLHLVQSDWFEMPLTFQWPFIWHQPLLCRERCFHWQSAGFIKLSTGCYISPCNATPFRTTEGWHSSRAPTQPSQSKLSCPFQRYL